MREVVANQFANKDIYQKVTDYLERHNYPRLVNRDNLIISVFPEAFPELMSYPLTEGYGNQKKIIIYVCAGRSHDMDCKSMVPWRH